MDWDYPQDVVELNNKKNELQSKYNELIALLFDYVNPASITHEEAILALKEIKEDAWKYKDLSE